MVSIDEAPEIPNRMRLTAYVTRLFADTDDSIAYSGILEDDTGDIRFVAWADAGPWPFREGRRYEIFGAESESYKGSWSVTLDSQANAREMEPSHCRCHRCAHVARTREAIQDHYSEVHGGTLKRDGVVVVYPDQA